MLAKLTVKSLDALNKLYSDDDGAIVVEYAMLIALGVLALTGVFTAYVTGMTDMMGNLADAINAKIPG
jgi:Flp pilus assembly pilin Flp